MWSLYRGGLNKKVVFKRWPLNKGFTLGCIYMTISIFHFHVPFPVSISTVSNCPTKWVGNKQLLADLDNRL